MAGGDKTPLFKFDFKLRNTVKIMVFAPWRMQIKKEDRMSTKNFPHYSEDQILSVFKTETVNNACIFIDDVAEIKKMAKKPESIFKADHPTVMDAMLAYGVVRVSADLQKFPDQIIKEIEEIKDQMVLAILEERFDPISRIKRTALGPKAMDCFIRLKLMI